MRDRTVDFRFAPSSRWTCVGRPDDVFKSLVREDGALLYDYVHPGTEGGLSGMFHRVVSFRILCEGAPLEITQASDEPANSIVHTKIRHETAELHLTTFGHRDARGRRTDVVLWKITATGATPSVDAAFAVSLQQENLRTARQPGRRGKISVMRVEDATAYFKPLPREPLALVLNPAHVKKSDEMMDWYNMAASFNLTPCTVCSPIAPLAPRESLEGAVIIPQGHQDQRVFSWTWAQRALAAERRYWRNLRLPRKAIEVPDPAIQAFIQACARNILQAREIKDGLPEFQVGPTCYRNLWVCDGYYLLQTARYLGLDEDARRGTRALLRRARPDGAIADMRHHTMETPISLAALVRQAELGGEWEELRRNWPLVRNAVGYIRKLRRQAAKLPAGHPSRGLLPPSYADGGMGGARSQYPTILWTLAGLRVVARAARRLGYRAEGEKIQADYEALLRAFRARAAKDLFRLPGGGPEYLRMWMRGQSDHVNVPGIRGALFPWQRLGPNSGTWAFAQSVYTGGILPPDDPLFRGMLRVFDATDNTQGLPETMGWLLDRSVWTYGPAFAAQAWLYAGRPDKAVDYLYAFANHAAPTRVWREEQSLKSTRHGHGNGDMPHNWASAEFIQLVRHLLVYEREDVLELLPGAPPEWMTPGSRIRLDRTPTRFGEVTLECSVDRAGRVRIRYQRKARGHDRPARVVLLLPAAAKRESVRLNGRPVRLEAGAGLELPAAGARVAFTLTRTGAGKR